jgi:hypothetical protein
MTTPVPHHRRTVGLALVAMLVVLSGACASRGRTVRIGTLLEDPGRYEGETVRVEGRVTSSAGALGYGAYRVNDGSGTINVVSTEHGAPAEGARVGVVGTFRAIYTFGASSGVAIVERSRYRP